MIFGIPRNCLTQMSKLDVMSSCASHNDMFTPYSTLLPNVLCHNRSPCKFYTDLLAFTYHFMFTCLYCITKWKPMPWESVASNMEYRIL